MSDSHPLQQTSDSAAGERGVALVLSLLLLTLLVVLITQFAWTAKVEEKVARNARDDLKMVMAARGTLAFVRAHLRADRADPETARVDSLREDWAENLNGPLTVGDVSLDLTVEDCERKLNVNLLANEKTKAFAAGALRRLVLRLLDQLEIEEEDAEVAERIIDYIDTDKEGDHESGAKNGPLLGPEELYAIRDIPIELLQGGVPEDADEETEPVPGLLEFLTAWGNERLNLNTISNDLLYAVLPDKDAKERPINRDDVIEAIEKFRTGGTEDEPAPEPEEGEERPGEDFKRVEDLTRIGGLTDIFPKQQTGNPSGQNTQQKPGPLPKELLSVTSQDFLITVTASREGLTRRFEALLRRGKDAFYVLMWRETTP
ncbi:hypothetical protein ACFL59_06195 [Planctomycetota bacterium]